MENMMLKLLIVFVMLVTTKGLSAQIDSTGLPGDHFSLEGALDLFKQASDLEAYEKALNTESNYVNNLDLNRDGEIDYVRVIDHMEDNAHAIVIQAIVGVDDAQDVAVIEIEKTAENEAILQIIGDEDIYGEEIIVEPYEQEPGKGGPFWNPSEMRIVVNVWLWPSVRFVYRPGYVAWVSPWRWMKYPRWWTPWRVHPYHWLVGVRPRYHLHYHPVVVHRVGSAHRIYVPRHTKSVVVHNHYHAGVTNYRKERGIVNTRKTTIVEGPRGGKAVIQREKTTAVGRNQNGAAGSMSKTETKVVGKNAKGEKVVAGKETTKVRGKKADGTSATVKRSETRAVKKTKEGRGVVKKSTTRVKKHSPRKN